MALRRLNLNLPDANLGEAGWDDILTMLIARLLPKHNLEEDGEVGWEPFSLERYKAAGQHDPCIMSQDRGRGRKRHQPMVLVPDCKDKQWAACTLTQQPDSRWLARFSNIPQFVRQEYERSRDLQRKHRTLKAYARPNAGRKIQVSRLICWWAYGPPRKGDVATHFACDRPRCLNPRHMGWATPADNKRHLEWHRDNLRRPRPSLPSYGTWRTPNRSNPPVCRQ